MPVCSSQRHWHSQWHTRSTFRLPSFHDWQCTTGGFKTGTGSRRAQGSPANSATTRVPVPVLKCVLGNALAKDFRKSSDVCFCVVQMNADAKINAVYVYASHQNLIHCELLGKLLVTITVVDTEADQL
jgi:hypothetical protein